MEASVAEEHKELCTGVEGWGIESYHRQLAFFSEWVNQTYQEKSLYLPCILLIIVSRLTLLKLNVSVFPQGLNPKWSSKSL